MPDYKRIADQLLAESTADCCMNEEWRGYACQYHEGFIAGMEGLIERLDLVCGDCGSDYLVDAQSDGQVSDG